ncbi:glycosyl transferase [Azospirillum brasilense]|nr:glycosyl transferase [Azospirillum brasilense]
MSGPLALFLSLAGSFALSWLLTGRVLAYLRHRAILDHPNDRSSHSIPTPRGGGWGVMLTLLPVWTLIAVTADDPLRALPILAGTVALMAVSWMDDRRGLGPKPRFLAQIAAVAAGISALPGEGLVFQGLLPFWADRLVAAVGWLWFVNLFNFMDGIDGLAGGEAASIGAGLALVASLGALDPSLPLYGLSAAGAALGFLVWNWHPAKLFMGDVGSVPLGFPFGLLLVALARGGTWPGGAGRHAAGNAVEALPGVLSVPAVLTAHRLGLGAALGVHFDRKGDVPVTHDKAGKHAEADDVLAPFRIDNRPQSFKDLSFADLRHG